MTTISNDPILVENKDRYVMFPIQDQDIWTMYKKQMDCFWRAEEIDLSKDFSHWEKMTKNEQTFVKMILAFFCCIRWYRVGKSRIEIYE